MLFIRSTFTVVTTMLSFCPLVAMTNFVGLVNHIVPKMLCLFNLDLTSFISLHKKLTSYKIFEVAKKNS